MKQELSKRLTEIRAIMLKNESIGVDLVTKALIGTHIRLVEDLNRQLGANIPQSGVYRLEIIRTDHRSGNKLYRARKGYARKREGFYIGNEAAVRQFIREHPGIYFVNLPHFGFQP